MDATELALKAVVARNEVIQLFQVLPTLLSQKGKFSNSIKIVGG